ncbi:helix-turn-helix domain-containing protein [Candidatus Micrarchaeota archaeon]|nr:helix-turn-helix domain-containing protein [Candidatus Micrarchaeota archaeon]
MQVIKAPSKNLLISEIRDVEPHHQEVYLNLRPTDEIIDALVAKCPGVRRIQCPPSLYKQTSKKLFKRLGDSGIIFQPGEFPVGRPKKYESGTVAQIVNMRKTGKPAKAIAKELSIPLRTVYFYLRREK